MTTAQRVFDIAMGLIDEVNENSGATDTPDTREYKARTLLILNALRGELYPYSDTYIEAEEKGKRAICAVIEDFDAPVDLDDFLCQSIMPYGLAAQLLLSEDAASASFLQQRYEELLRSRISAVPKRFERIYDMYGGIEHGEYGRW